MPARRKRFRIKNKKKKNKRSYKPLVAFILLVLISSFFVISRGEWDRSTKISIVAPDNRGNVSLMTFDPIISEITRVNIPASTEVEVARGLGKLRIKNVQALAEDEGVGGLLLAETVTRYMKLPVYFWADNQFLKLSQKSVLGVIKVVLTPLDTNLSFADKVKLAIFSLKTKESNIEVVDLGKTAYLTEKKLTDGDEGYVKGVNTIGGLASLYADDYISDNQISVSVVDSTGMWGVAEDVGEVLEVLGAKTAVIIKRDSADFDCKISSGDKVAEQRINKYFNCELADNDSNFDLQIELGASFARRY